MDFYTNLTHAEYKIAEDDMRKCKETVHTSVEGFYHKSIRIRIGSITLELHGPAVKAAELPMLTGSKRLIEPFKEVVGGITADPATPPERMSSRELYYEAEEEETAKMKDKFDSLVKSRELPAGS